jgi:hypothetical protein
VSVLWRQRGVAALTRPPTMNRTLP